MGDFTDSVKEYQNLVAFAIAAGYGAYKVRSVLVQIGHTLEIEGEICTRSKTDVLVDTQPYVRKLGDGIAEPPIAAMGGQILRDAGCNVINRKISLPSTLTPGSYQVYAEDTVVGTGETLTWKSQPFPFVGP